MEKTQKNAPCSIAQITQQGTAAALTDLAQLNFSLNQSFHAYL
jgi:hypothetical protein